MHGIFNKHSMPFHYTIIWLVSSLGRICSQSAALLDVGHQCRYLLVNIHNFDTFHGLEPEYTALLHISFQSLESESDGTDTYVYSQAVATCMNYCDMFCST